MTRLVQAQAQEEEELILYKTKPRWMIVRTVTLLVILNSVHTLISNTRFVRDMMTMSFITTTTTSTSRSNNTTRTNNQTDRVIIVDSNDGRGDDHHNVFENNDVNRPLHPPPIDISALANSVIFQVNSTLSYAQYLGGPPPYLHPFAGALDENQTWGYVHNARALHHHHHHHRQNNNNNDPRGLMIDLNELERQEVCLAQEQIVSNRNLTAHISRDGYRVLDKVQVNNHSATTSTGGHAPPRVLCAIYTYEGHKDNIKAITETWGKRCDGFLAASTYTDATMGIVHIPHFGREGSYDSIWQKVRSMLVYLYQNYFHHQQYDYFHISGDDTYVIVENLKQYLLEDTVVNATKHQQPVYAGGWIKPFWRLEGRRYGLIYNGGGPGYTLNGAALQLFVQQGLAVCNPNVDKSEEDFFMGLCLKQIANMTTPTDTTDATYAHGNAARYHHLDPNNLLDQKNPQLKRFTTRQAKWRQQQLGEPTDAMEAISPHSVSFHLIKHPNYMRRLDTILYPQGTMAKYCASATSTTSEQVKPTSF